MATLLWQLRFRNRISRVFLFGCALALAVPPQEVLAQATQATTTICKQTNPSPDPWGTSFNFTGANGWPATSGKDFTTLYTPNPIPTNPFPLKDGQCYTINITGHDAFNKFTEKPVPPGWALTNIFCSYTKSVVSIIGADPNRAFQPGDNTVTIDQADPNVKCTFVNTLACFRPTGLSLPPCTRPGEPVTLDLSTTLSPGGADPNWTVTPGGPHPFSTSLAAWTALPSNWVQPAQTVTAAPHAAGGKYTYTRVFNLPCPPKSYRSLELSGNFAADNTGRVYLNTCVLANCAPPNSNCFSSPSNPTPFAPPPASCFYPGLNNLTVTVGNLPNSYTGLSVVAKLTAICGPDCVCGCPPGTVLQDGQCVPSKFPIGKKGQQPRKGPGSR